ncbi:expressed conserved protein [Echinococcus multilocularis]|uniref:Expressed conserved protein n=1 Tax=Echinococcus multilocularis TaxID=6211 RepID=A0A068YA18_ECHMU|nr:expressed conserved protein [Echinococcus multilocularis]
MSNVTSGTKENVEEEKWYETTLPIALTVILSVILLILIIVRVVQCCQERRAKKHLKRAKAKDHSLEEGEEKEKQSKTSAPKKRRKLIKLGKLKEAADGADAAPIVPVNENGSLLQSGIRTHPTRQAENKSWYDSKVIPYIDDGGASLDNLYLPDNAIQEVVPTDSSVLLTSPELTCSCEICK